MLLALILLLFYSVKRCRTCSEISESVSSDAITGNGIPLSLRFKHPGCRVVSAPDFGSRLPYPNPGGRGIQPMTDCTELHCTEPFIIALPSSRNDSNNVERGVKLLNHDQFFKVCDIYFQISLLSDHGHVIYIAKTNK